MRTTLFALLVAGLSCLFMLPGAVAHGQTTTADTPVVERDTPVAAQRSVLESKARPTKERLQALGAMFQAKESLSKTEQVELLRSTRSVASDRSDDAQLRADAIWVLGGMGMMLKHDKTWTQQDVSRECQFLLNIIADESENLQVRRVSIAALGNLEMKEAVPMVKALLSDTANINRPEIARSASIALAELAPAEALQPVGQVLTETSDPYVFGSAAYALGLIKSRDAIPVLVENRLRLGDNLPVDNAVEALSDIVFEILKEPSDPRITAAIQATRSLWRDEQKAQYSPLLRGILADKTLPANVRREALKRLLEDADALPLDIRKQQISIILPIVEGEETFRDEVARMQMILNARMLPTTRTEGQDEKGGVL